ncbi:glycoside hydrolase family 3 protein [Pontibacter arcticus]|uniref:beta-N-acetylhexosaminidase n=1 Tax=Pontibacter arcticus TaxID=2080288 RepID=A0A364RC67_9BACT|nr:glycoside hydrolase family 3 N-terminal domain-containing protein [Pontibacter arcticus]RAU81756.1 glycoside hydrolase family 3 [Pontibacter arcticus]
MLFHHIRPSLTKYVLIWSMLLLLCTLLAGCDSSDARGQKTYKAVHAKAMATPAVPYKRPDNLLEALALPPSTWVDSVFKTLTPEERIAQLIIIEAFSNKGKKYEADVLNLIQKYKVGGIIFFQGGPVRQAKLTNRFQAASKVPLMIAMDAETGVGMRLDSTMQYPFQQMLGAIQDNGLIYAMGAEVAEEFKRLGMHINFAPVADINNNPNNPIISYRAFGEDRQDVTAKSLAYMQGMQENGIIAVAKHFPGHGDTNIDSHYDLPVIPFNRQRLDSLELYPFRELIKYGLGGMMVGHMHLPQLDSTKNLPSTLSKPIVTDLLRDELKYNGLIFTDAMVMKGVTKYFKPGEAEARALIAGNDVLERLNSVPKAIQAVKLAIANGEISQQEIDRRCKRILAAKQWLGLHTYKPIPLPNLHTDLNPSVAHETNKHLAEASLTVLRNQKRMLPLRTRRKARIATLSVGAVRPTAFQKYTSQLTTTKNFTIRRKASIKYARKLAKQLAGYDVVLVALYGPDMRPSTSLGYGKPVKDLVVQLAKSNKAAIVLFDNAYTLNQFPGIEKSRALVVAYQPQVIVQQSAAKLLFGYLPARGQLPVTVNKHFVYGDGIIKNKPLHISLTSTKHPVSAASVRIP